MEKLKREETDTHVMYVLGPTIWTFDKRDYSRMQMVLERLFEYQETGLEPEEVTDLMASCGTAIGLLTWYRTLGCIGHLRELSQADRDGRLAVLPCKVGDAAYWVHNGVITDCRVNRIQINRAGLFICLRSKVSHGAFSARCFGKSVFFSRREAETALKGDDQSK